MNTCCSSKKRAEVDRVRPKTHAVLCLRCVLNLLVLQPLQEEIFLQRVFDAVRAAWPDETLRNSCFGRTAGGTAVLRQYRGDVQAAWKHCASPCKLQQALDERDASLAEASAALHSTREVLQGSGAALGLTLTLTPIPNPNPQP